MMKIYWKHDISLLKKRREPLNYICKGTKYMDYDFFGFKIGKIVIGVMFKTGESNDQ